MELKILDKIMITSILPFEGNIKTLIIVKDLKDKISLTQDELLKYDIQATENGGIKWNKEGEDAIFTIEFTELEKNEIKCALKKLDSENKLSIDMLRIVKLFEV